MAKARKPRMTELEAKKVALAYEMGGELHAIAGYLVARFMGGDEADIVPAIASRIKLIGAALLNVYSDGADDEAPDEVLAEYEREILIVPHEREPYYPGRVEDLMQGNSDAA